MGVAALKLTPILVDNMVVMINATNLGSSLNKKAVALSCHFVHEHEATNVMWISKIYADGNYADPFTKGFPSK